MFVHPLDELAFSERPKNYPARVPHVAPKPVPAWCPPPVRDFLWPDESVRMVDAAERIER